MTFTAEDVVFLGTSTEIMDPATLTPPPSYDDAIAVHKLPAETALETTDCFEDFADLATATAEKPPQTKWLVKSDKEPSYLKLLTGPIISNAGGTVNTEPLRKRRYKVVFPPGYEDVYLHKTAWASNSSNLPLYHVEVFGRDRYEPEPIVILGPTDFHHDTLIAQSREYAAKHIGKVFCKMEDEISKTQRFVAFCETEYFSWDWKWKTGGAKQDMRSLIVRARRDCFTSAALVVRLEQFLDFAGRQNGGQYEDVLRGLRRSLKECAWRLNRLQI
ncbi:hypothetical protein AC578_4374 [Pseudocercospora eumusae]|uniref:Uncharacterized protein n=1 Tax=Pseudocercospora eumusae TaxID=321146 RepID=A0A139H610_9PEZI|nr:hypothetical protein AC578_4374 [Pseudocercospora eumusae]